MIKQSNINGISMFKKLKVSNTKLSPKHSVQAIVLAWLGGFLAISAVALLSNIFSVAFILGSFGASCVLVFGFPDASFSQPRNVLLGHFLSSFIGLACLTLFGATWWSVAIAVATAISVMMLTRTTHPPAGSNPVIIYLTKPTWSFLLFPTVFGAIALICVALVYNYFTRKKITPVKTAPPIPIRISCHNCSHNNPASFNFCTRCGTRLNKQHTY